MNVLVAGKAKTGTTIISRTIHQAIPGAAYHLEPMRLEDFAQAGEGGRPNVVKLIYEHWNDRPAQLQALLDNETPLRFQRVVAIVRDIRDELVSRLFYAAYPLVMAGADGDRINAWIAQLEAKERTPERIGVVELLQAYRRLFGKDLMPELALDHQYLGFIRANRDRLFVLRYEDFIARRWQPLERYLGIALAGTVSLGSLQRVRRTAESGNWRSFFTPADVSHLRPLYGPILREYGYEEDDWALEPATTLDPAQGSGYVRRLVTEAARHRQATLSQGVTAVIVAYHPSLEVLAAVLETVLPQVGSVVIVDNGSTPDVGAWVASRGCANLHYLSLGANRGVAAAHNAGIAWARAHGSDYVLLLDQDSVPAPDMVQKLLAAWQALVARGAKVAAVGPRYRDPRHGHTSQFVRFGWLRRPYVECTGGEAVAADFLISSGSLIPLRALDAVGAMEEGLFIDHVDTEWFLRAQARGLAAYGVCDAFMEHRLGEQAVTLRLLGRTRFVPYHALVRHAYIFRNSLLLYRRAYAPWRWIVHDAKRLLFSLVFYALFVPPRLLRLRMMLLGLWLGLRGRSGPIPAPGTGG